jgi:hypothetical protein
MERAMQKMALLVIASLVVPSIAAAQTPAHDPSARLSEVLPPDVAEKVLERIAAARARGLPAAALEHRALEASSKGAPPSSIEGIVAEQASAMERGKAALAQGGRSDPADEEVDAAGTALGQGVDGSAISDLAKSAPSGRSLAVPIAVITSLTARGLPSDDALQQVLAKIQARASDRELQQLPDQAAPAQPGRPEVTGQGIAGARRPADAGPPTSLPANAGGAQRPSPPSRPQHPGGRP